MIREVYLTRKAEQQLHATSDWYTKNSAKIADNWFNGIVAAMNELTKTPNRFPLARENDDFPFELRELHYGLGKRKTHCVLYVVRPDKIVVYQVRHVAQREVTPDDE